MSQDINGIPVETFDPSKHLVECREITEGRTVFTTLQSLMAAEDAIDAQSPAPPSGQGVTPEQLADLEERIIRNMRDAIPPPQFPADMLQLLTDTTQALIVANKRIAELEAVVATHTENFRAVMQLAGGEQ